VSAVHVADQGGITALNSPAWMGWEFRVIEVAGVLTAVVLLLPWSSWLGWAAAMLLGAGPFLGYMASRSVGMPGDHADVGNWGYWLGTVSLIVEAALVILSAGMLLAMRGALIRRLLPPGSTGTRSKKTPRAFPGRSRPPAAAGYESHATALDRHELGALPVVAWLWAPTALSGASACCQGTDGVVEVCAAPGPGRGQDAGG
jgi:hypothetical protein